MDLDYEITITDTSGNEKQYLSVDDLDESAQPKSDGNLMTVKLDTVAPRVETLTLASTNSSTNSDLGSNTLLAKKDDKVTLTFTTSERVINPEVQINNFQAETSYLNFDGDDDKFEIRSISSETLSKFSISMWILNKDGDPTEGNVERIISTSNDEFELSIGSRPGDWENKIGFFSRSLGSVSYTHLTLPTKA